jgi:hypothetical protein
MRVGADTDAARITGSIAAIEQDKRPITEVVRQRLWRGS